jgi:hypothetical protein
MLQYARFMLWLALIPPAAVVATAAAVVECVTGEDPLGPEGDGIQREPEDYQRFKRCDGR